MSPETKFCPKCKTTKPLSAFYCDAAKKDGRGSACKECDNARKRRWYQDNIDDVKARRRQARVENAKEERRRKRQDYYRNKKKRTARMRAWRRENKAKSKAIQHQGYCNRVGAPGTFTETDVKRKKREQGGMCVYSGKQPRCKGRLGNSYHVDHIVPLSRGGTNHPRNIQLLCPFCNMSKNDKTHEEYLDWLDTEIVR